MSSAMLSVNEAVQMAIASFERGDLKEAERLCRMALKAKPDSFEPLYILGVIAGRTQHAKEAADLLAAALELNPGHADAHFNRGVALVELGQPEEALAEYARVGELAPGHADAHYNRGALLGALGRHAEALESYDRALALKPRYAEAHRNRGVALDELDRHDEALASYERALALRPDYAGAWNNRGAALGKLGRFDEALASFDRAIALKPDYVDAHNHRAIALLELDRPAEALASGERAIAQQPLHADAWYNSGNALRELHRHRDALECYERAIELSPAHTSAHWNLADCLLLLGDFERGWQEYEWRWKLWARRAGRREFREPLWLGAEALEGGAILLHSELGLGDTLQFCRYATEVARRGAKVILEVQPPLVALLATLEGVAQVLPRGSALPPFDCHCPLMSLPLAFRTHIGNVPTAVPYLRSDPARVAAWRSRLGGKGGPRVGLVWSGSQGLRNDKRSMALADMLPLLGADAEWIGLQKEVPGADAALLASRPDLRNFGGDLADFADTAALVELMDLVITVDTSVAHVAGALCKPVWILLPFNPHDWRWLLDREDSLWYPSARLFRQPSAGDWTGVVRRVKEELPRQLRA